MIKLSSIKIKILILIAGIGIVLSLLLAFYSPQQSKTLARDLLYKDVAFITDLLAENLGIGMQTIILDDGQALEQTLELLKEDPASKDITISRIKVFNESLEFVKGLNTGKIEKAGFSASDNTQLLETDHTLVAWSPMRDADGNILGYVEIDFSKEFLLNRTAATSRKSFLISVVIFLINMVLGYYFVQRIVSSLQILRNAAEKVANGDVEVDIDVSSKDEVGELAESIRRVVESLKAKAQVAHEIAQGNISVETNVLSEKDELGKAMEIMKQKITAMTSDVKKLATAVLEGNLNERVNISQHNGEYASIVQGVNNTLDAVSSPIREASEALEKLANRDLTSKMHGNYKGDFAKLKNSLNIMVDNLNQALQQVSSGAQQVHSASNQISSGSQSLAQAASEQASSLQEVSSSLKEMASMTRQNSNNTKEASSMSRHTSNKTDEGMGSMTRLSDVMDKIKTSSDETSKIIKTIDDIAFQTNLLALNAAVEAARAGEAGKGFAVVAEEVRNLAMRSAEAAKNTADLIEQAVNNAEEGVNVNQEVMKNLEEIREQVLKVNEVMNEITTASDQQTNGIEQLNSAIDQLNQLTQQNAANSEESASTAQELSSQATEMMNMVDSFNLTNVGHKMAVRADGSISDQF